MTEKDGRRVEIRPAEPEDAAALCSIYRPYVEKTAVSFEYEVPSEMEFKRRIEAVRARWPYLVLEEAGRVLGYAYAAAFHERAAYAHCVETSIYLSEEARGRGLGRLLHDALIRCLRERGFLNVYACIAVPREEKDPYLTRQSMEFHAHLGYRTVGSFKSCGLKFGRWYDMVYMELLLGPHEDAA